MATELADTQDPRDQIKPDEALAAVRTLLLWVGEDPFRDGLRDTPKRVAKAWREMTAGACVDPAEALGRVFDVAHDEMVLLKGIRFASLCEHHVLPFTGTADVGYIPRGKVVGISKLARLVHGFARRLQVQERLTDQIADAIEQTLDPLGVFVVVRAHHQCMGCRGVVLPEALMVTSAMRGAFKDDAKARAEALAL